MVEVAVEDGPLLLDGHVNPTRECAGARVFADPRGGAHGRGRAGRGVAGTLRARLLRCSAAAGAALVLAALTVGAARAHSSPGGGVDLSKMTLSPSDLAPGATVLGSTYDPPGAGLHLRAQYDRDFGACSTTSHVQLAQVQTAITLADTAAYAKALFAQLPSIYGGQSGRAILAQEVIPRTGKGSDATPKDAHFGKPRSVGVGQQSLFESATIVTKDARVAADFVFLRVDDVTASLAIVAVKPSLADSVAIGLARTVAAHIASVLAAKGNGS
jgi:hypothetical protein